MNWADQYKHPLWQKKRLEALSAADYACQCCGGEDAQLHVHHKQYFKGRLIWEYSVNELSVLCDQCHHELHKSNDALKQVVSLLHPDGIAEVAALVAGFCSFARGPSMNDVVIDECINADPYSFYVGRIAAAFYNKHTPIQTLIDLAAAIDQAGSDGVVSIEIPGNRGFSG